jgi:hypothetical protein
MSRGLRAGHIVAIYFPAGAEAMVTLDACTTHQSLARSPAVRADNQSASLAGDE